MEIKGIKYLGPIFDGSGYAGAGRNYIIALLSQGVPITIDPVRWDRTPPRLDEKELRILHSLVGKEIDYNIVIHHVVPANLTSPPHEWVDRTGKNTLVEPGKFNILNTVWETDKFHQPWVDLINHNADAVIVPCEWNKEVFERSGVKIPVIKIPHCIEPRKYIKRAYPEFYTHDAKDKFTFYCVGQWASPHIGSGLGSRKRIEDLIRVFKHVFAGVPDVELILKVFGSDNRFTEQAKIQRWIQILFDRINMDLMPRKDMSRPPQSRVGNIVFEGNSLSAADMLVLHQRADCFVLFSSGEGFLLPAFEASCVGVPTITTGYGGVLEYLNKKNSYLVDYRLEPVFGFYPAKWYTGDMRWASPDLDHAAKLMKHVYLNPDEARMTGALAQKTVFERFTREKVGAEFVEKLGKL